MKKNAEKNVEKYFTMDDDFAAWFPISGPTVSIAVDEFQPNTVFPDGKLAKDYMIATSTLATDEIKFAWSRQLPIGPDGGVVIPGYIRETKMSELFADYLPLTADDWQEDLCKTPSGEIVPRPTWPRPALGVGYGVFNRDKKTFLFMAPKLSLDVVVTIALNEELLQHRHEFELWLAYVEAEIGCDWHTTIQDQGIDNIILVAPMGDWAEAAMKNRQAYIDQLLKEGEEEISEYNVNIEDYWQRLSVLAMSMAKFYGTTMSFIKGTEIDIISLRSGKMHWAYVATPERVRRLEHLHELCNAIATSNKGYINVCPELLFMLRQLHDRDQPVF